MDVQAQVDQYLALDKQIAELEKQKKEIAKNLLSVSQIGDVLEGSSGKVRVQQQNILDDSVLREKISASMWTRISVRKSVAALLSAEVKRGKISEDIVNASRKPGASFLKKA